MEKVKFTISEVKSFLEEKVLMDIATQEELELYEDYQWSGKLNKTNYTYKTLVVELRKLWERKF